MSLGSIEQFGKKPEELSSVSTELRPQERDRHGAEVFSRLSRAALNDAVTFGQNNPTFSDQEIGFTYPVDYDFYPQHLLIIVAYDMYRGAKSQTAFGLDQAEQQVMGDFDPHVKRLWPLHDSQVLKKAAAKVLCTLHLSASEIAQLLRSAAPPKQNLLTLPVLQEISRRQAGQR